MVLAYNVLVNVLLRDKMIVGAKYLTIKNLEMKNNIGIKFVLKWQEHKL